MANVTTATRPRLLSQARRHPSALGFTVASLLLPGLGQVLNRQRLKGLIFFLVPLALFTLEWTTSHWADMGEGYRQDASRYFGQSMGPVGESQAAALAEVTGKSVTLAYQETELVDASTLGEGFDYGTVSLKSDVSGPLAGAHGWVFSPDAAAALYGGEPTEAQYSALANTLWAPVRDTLAAGPVAATVSLAPATVAQQSEAKVELAGPVVRVRYAITIDDTDQGFLIEYFPRVLAEAAVGPDFRGTETLYPVRDYGGYLSRGLYGLVTLGNLVIGDSYRGLDVETFNADKPWASADNSSITLARGLIALVILLLAVFLWVLCVTDAWKTRVHFLESGETLTLRQFLKQLWEEAYVWILIAPAAVLIVFFTLIPFLFTFLTSFTDWTYKVSLVKNLVHWKGLAEYGVVFGEPAWLTIFFQVFGWTVLWALVSSASVYLMGFAHALVVESPLVKGKKFWRTVLIVPWSFPALISLMAFKSIFDKDGLFNQILMQTGTMKGLSNILFAIGLEGRPDDIIYWFDPSYNANLAKFVVLMVNLWLGAPYFMMLITGIISTIPADRYEAAMIDGANGWQKLRYITAPMVLNATTPALIMTVTFNFNNFGAVYFLTGGGPAWLLEKLPDSLRVWTNSMPGQTDILISWIYKISFNPNAQLYNKAAVYSVFIFLLLGVFSVINMKLSKTFSDEGEE